MTTPHPPTRRRKPLWAAAAAATVLAAASWLPVAPVSGSTAQPLALVPAAAASAAVASASAPAATPLAQLPAPAGEAMAHTCAACHGTEGRLGDEAFMPLAGMPRGLFTRTMQAFRSGARPSTLMGHVAQGFTDADLAAMAAYFESVPNPEAAR